MPDVVFHAELSDKIGYACRLLRKAARQGHRVRVLGEAVEIDLLDQALWSFDPRDFVPHVRLRQDKILPAMARTPLWLQPAGEPWPEGVTAPAVVVNLGPGAVPEANDAQRLIELVGDDDTERQAGRIRWRAYRSQGLEPRAVQPGAAT